MASQSLGGSKSPLVLSIDIGTSSVKTGLFDMQGQLAAGSLARRPVDLLTGADGTAVIDPDSLLETVWTCIDQTLANREGKPQQIAGVGACTFVSNILGVDTQGRASTPIYTYADTRPAAQANLLKEQLDEAAVHQRTGCILHPSYLPARFAWFKQVQPELLKAGYSWMTFGEYLALKLFGETAVSYSAASWSGLLDRFTLDWDGELLAALQLDRKLLSDLVDVDQSWSGLKSPFSERWSVLQDIPWFPAVGDGAAANLGSGCINAQRLALTVGSTSAMRVTLEEDLALIPHGLWSYRVDRQHVLLGGALSEGGNVLTWLKDTFRLEPSLELEEILRERSGVDQELIFLPLLAGERSPGWNGSARGIIAGLSLATTPVDILVAALYGIAVRIGLVYNLLKTELPAGHTVIANGGALVRSPAWVQVIADMLGCEVTLSEVEEASARGAAILALRSLGLAPDLMALPAFTGRVFTPDPERHAFYQQVKESQQRLYRLF